MIRDCAVCVTQPRTRVPRTVLTAAGKRNQRSGATTLTSLEPKPGSLVTARHLSLANALDTPAGQLALLLAWAMESPYQSGSGVAALSKELTRVMQIIEGEQVTRDPLDELQARLSAEWTVWACKRCGLVKTEVERIPRTSGDPEGNAGF